MIYQLHHRVRFTLVMTPDQATVKMWVWFHYVRNCGFSACYFKFMTRSCSHSPIKLVYTVKGSPEDKVEYQSFAVQIFLLQSNITQLLVGQLLKDTFKLHVPFIKWISVKRPKEGPLVGVNAKLLSRVSGNYPNQGTGSPILFVLISAKQPLS